MWQDTDLEQIRKFLGLSVDGTNQIELKQRELLMTSPQAVLTARSYIDRIKVLAELIDDSTSSNAGATKIVSSTGEIHEYPEGEPFDTLRAEARRYIGLLADLIDLHPRVDYFSPVTEFNAVPGGGVRSFKGRSGIVTPEPGDYEIGDITGLASALAARAPLNHSHPDILAALEEVTGIEGIQTHIDDRNNPHEVTAVQVGAVTVSEFAAHLMDQTNPHEVTAEQVGAATTTALSNHTGNTSNPHNVTAEQVGAAPTVHTHGELQPRSDLLDDIVSAFAAATDGQSIQKQGTALVYATPAGGGGGEWLTVTSDRTCQTGDRLYVDASSGTVKLTLPASGDLEFYVSLGSSANIVVLQSSGTIEGVAESRLFGVTNRYHRTFKAGGDWKLPPFGADSYNGLPGYVPAALTVNGLNAGSPAATIRNMNDLDGESGTVCEWGSPAWIRYDLGAAKECNRLAVWGGNIPGWGICSTYLNDSKLQYSSNGTDWTDAVTITGVGDNAPFVRTISFTAATARYWRLSKASDWLALTGFQVYKV